VLCCCAGAVPPWGCAVLAMCCAAGLVPCRRETVLCCWAGAVPCCADGLVPCRRGAVLCWPCAVLLGWRRAAVGCVVRLAKDLSFPRHLHLNNCRNPMVNALDQFEKTTLEPQVRDPTSQIFLSKLVVFFWFFWWS
jgi:hypothetical protein